MSRRDLGGALLLMVLAVAGCERNMIDQPRAGALEATEFFDNGSVARPPVPGSVARGQLRIDSHRYQGKVDGKDATTLPMPLTAELLERGHQRFNIFCSPCHDRVGNGQGMVVQRGFPAPPSYHNPRLRDAPVGHLFDVATHGFGRMPSYAAQIPTDDRWAIVAYVKALQLSQHAEVDQLVETDRKQLKPGKQP